MITNEQLCKDARRIQAILAKGYHIAIWPNNNGQQNYYLVKNGDEPHKGAYLSKVK